MDNKIVKDWNRNTEESVITKISEKVHHAPPLKERISEATYRLKLQADKLEQATSRMQHHDRELFEKCVSAQLARDNSRATIYANECAEVRKMARVIMLSQLAIEQVMLRLETIEEFGEVMTGMAPVSGVIRTLKGRLSGIIPEVSYELGSVDEMLNGMMVDTGEASGTSLTVDTSNEESKKILNEAGAIAEQKLREKFPDLPASERNPSVELEKPDHQ
jgi:division protein CdvB (Snf7/Vps24/ESCRT-III family)